MNTQHTPGPLVRVDISTAKRVNGATAREQLCYNGYAAMILEYAASEEGEANAARLVRAYNAHDDLLAACREIVAAVDAGAAKIPPQIGMRLAAAIAKAEGNKKP